MRTHFNATLTIACLGMLSLSGPAFSADDGNLLIEIPAAISEPKASPATTPISEPPSETLIGLPSERDLQKPAEQPKKPKDPESLISLPQENKPLVDTTAPAPQTPQEPPPLAIPATEGSAEIIISGEAPPLADQAQPGVKTGLPVFPKDTSSAIFMVMKTWECDNYDGRTLLEHAIGVYAKESEDAFSVKGMDALSPFKVTLKESDITLDELLDVVSQKAGIDWGVDIEQKTIYLYPTHLQ